MASFNRVVLMGNLTRDPEVSYLQSGVAVGKVSLAVNRSWFDKQSNQRKEEVTYVNVTLWGRTAEVASEYSVKGSSVLIEGRLKLDQWTDKNSGEKRSALSVVGESYTMLGRRPEGVQGDGGRQQYEGSHSDGSFQGDGPPAATDPFNEEEVPF